MPVINKNTNSYIYKKDDSIVTTLFNTADDTAEHVYSREEYPRQYAAGEKILKIIRTRSKTVEEKNIGIQRILEVVGVSVDVIGSRLYDTSYTVVDPDTGEITKSINKQRATAAINKLINFFSEWHITPSLRFVNSLVLNADPITYTKNYFYIQDHPDALSISEKIKSVEYRGIINEIKSSAPEPNPINSRLVIYFGAPGAGKTYKATELTSKQIPCSSDMLPADIVNNFAFTDGKPNFDPSDICNAMENGEQILLDEINLLPYPTLRFLQTITDNKESIDFKGRKINIHPDFKIYGTMNLNVDGHPQPIPEPLADRAQDIVEFKLTADDLLRALE